MYFAYSDEDGPRNNLLESELIKATIDMLKSTEEHVQRSGLDLTAALIAYGTFVIIIYRYLHR